MNVFLYVRVSTVDQAEEGYSIQEQTARLTAYCKAMDWNVLKVYTDPGFSGASMDRPALKDMILNIKDADKVVVYKLDRLSRSQLDTIYLIEKVFLSNGVDFVSMCENFDTSTPFGRAMIGILAVFAQLEREQIKERMMMGREARAKEGKYCGCPVVPVGYDFIDDKLVVNEFEKVQLLDIQQMLLNGFTINKIRLACEEKGYTIKGKHWNNKTLQFVLRSRLYLGDIKFRGIWHKGIHEPIFSQEDFDKANQILDKKRDSYFRNRRPGRVQSLLGGLLVCRFCGEKYQKKTNVYKDIRYCYYSCRSFELKTKCKNKNWRMDDLDNLVIGEIKKLATDPKYKRTAARKKDYKVLENEIEKLDEQIDKLIDLYSIGGISATTIQTKVDEIQTKKEKLRKEIQSVKYENEKAEKQNLTNETLYTFSEVMEQGTFEKKRRIIELLIDRIELSGEDVFIYWNF